MESCDAASPRDRGLAALTILVLLTVPAANLRFGMPDAGSGTEDLASKRAYGLVSERFGPGANGPPRDDGAAR